MRAAVERVKAGKAAVESAEMETEVEESKEE